MTEKQTIGFIGAGNMGTAMINGLIQDKKDLEIQIYDVDSEKSKALSQKYAINISDSPEKLVDSSNIVILSVKPDAIETVLETIKKNIHENTILVSIAAGIKITTIESVVGKTTKIVRVMPNTPALVGEGISVISPNRAIDEHQIGVINDIFSSIGSVLQLPEKNMDAVTGLSGSGPAFVFTFIQALADGGVKMGIPRDKAVILAAQTVLGSAKLVLEGDEDPISLRGRVTSPGGTTIEGVHTLERSGFSGIVIDAVERAAMKSKKLGDS